jgi:WD40 repeat protein
MNGQKEPDDSELGVSTIVDAVAWSPNGSLLAIGSGDYWGPDGTENFWVRVVNVATQQVVFTAPHQGAVQLAWSPSCADLFIGSRSGAIQRYSVTTGTLQAALAPRKPTIWYTMASMSLSPDGSRIAAIFRRTVGNMEFTIYDTQSFQPVVSVDLPFTSQYGNVLTWVGYSPDGTLLATTGWDGIVRLWDANTLSQVAALNTSPGKRLYTGDWSDDGRLAVGGQDHYISVWNVSAQQIINHNDIGGVGYILRWHPDGRQIATGSGSSWDSVTGQRVQVGIPNASAFAIDWSPTGVLAVGIRAEGRLTIPPNDNPVGVLAALCTVPPLPIPD